MARRSDHTRPELTQLALESAREIVASEGINALSGRKVTARMGYTIGTLYQVFDDMDDLVEQMNAQTLEMLYDHCQQGARQDDVAQQLKALGILFGEFVKAHPFEWDAIMSYRYKDDHTTSEAYHSEILRLFGLMETATRQFYDKGEEDEHAADMAMLWASLTGILGVAFSERQVGGSLEQMLEHLIAMYLKARS
ncbi:MAG: TetR/AcrR family transcriptional regulator [Silicimonas sp.]|nr:TetR/AcrR family transcriptional regulator [Silicimonas sp.]